MSPRRTTLLRKGLLIILLPVVSQIALFGLLLYQQRSHVRVQELAVHTKDVLQELDALVETLLLRQVDLRGRLLGLPPEEDQTLPATEQLSRELERLTALFADNPKQEKRVGQLRETIAARSEWATQMRAFIDAGQRDEALRRFQTGAGSNLMEKIQSQVSEIRTDEERLDRERLIALRNTTRLQNVLVSASLVVTVLIAGLSMWLFSRGVARRVMGLAENVERLRRNETLAPGAAVNDELGDLDQSFHQMASALSTARTRDQESQRLIERRNSELTRANHELAQKNQENEMFVYSVSHDLRSPLVNLQGFSRELGLVRDDLRILFDSDLTETGRARGRQLIDRDISESIRYIQTAVMRLSTIIDALLRLSRAGRVEYRPQLLPLGPIVERIVSTIRGTIVERQATVNIQELPAVWGDAAAIEQIFANLIGNAVNYLDPQRPGVIEVGFLPATDGASDDQVFFVRDNGLGIAEAYLPKVFAIFQRLHASMAPGEGIGLALVRRVAERHGGRIWVESTEGVGSTFFVALPHEETSPLKLVPKKETLSVRLPEPITPLPATHVH